MTEQAPNAADEEDTTGERPGLPDPEPSGSKQPSGRVRHDEKVTVYLTSAELLDLEQARLTLRAQHGLAVDRGRLVREAVSLALAELDAKSADCALVQRLRSGSAG
jgi:hypothetical protein